MLHSAPTSNKHRILIVDDDHEVVDVIQLALEACGYQARFTYSVIEAREIIDSWRPHLILIDVNLPHLNEMVAIKRLGYHPEHFSIIMISGNNTPEEIIAGLDAGADDYIAKPFDTKELLARVRAQLRIKDINDQLLRTNAHLKKMVDTDDLTGLLNMRSLYSRLNYEIARGKRYNRTVCVVMMDLDHFKSVNDGHDHLFGSFVLSEIGKLIKASIRNVDIAARFGGDEFLIVLTEIDRETALVFCDRLRMQIENYSFQNGTDEMSLTTSIGFAITDPKSPDIDGKQLVKIADRALYDAKRSGRNLVCYFDLAENPEFMQQPVKNGQ
jgi:two-component system, cell cycle response regulator